MIQSADKTLDPIWFCIMDHMTHVGLLDSRRQLSMVSKEINERFRSQYTAFTLTSSTIGAKVAGSSLQIIMSPLCVKTIRVDNGEYKMISETYVLAGHRRGSVNGSLPRIRIAKISTTEDIIDQSNVFETIGAWRECTPLLNCGTVDNIIDIFSTERGRFYMYEVSKQQIKDEYLEGRPDSMLHDRYISVNTGDLVIDNVMTIMVRRMKSGLSEGESRADSCEELLDYCVKLFARVGLRHSPSEETSAFIKKMMTFVSNIMSN